MSMHREIDTLTNRLSQIQPSQTDDAEALLLQLKEVKKHYREVFTQFQEKKGELQYLSKIKQQMLQHVTLEFNEWKEREGH